MFFLASGFYIINCNSRWIKTKSNHFNQREGFTSDYSNSDQDSTRGKNVASTAITTTSTTVIVNTNIQPQVQQVKSSHLLPYQNISDPSRKPVWPVRRGKENKQKSWKTSLATDENQNVYSCGRLFPKPTLAYR